MRNCKVYHDQVLEEYNLYNKLVYLENVSGIMGNYDVGVEGNIDNKKH